MVTVTNINDDGGQQEQIDAVNMGVVKFAGVNFEAVELPGLFDEVEFLVRGRVSFEGRRVMKNGTVRDECTVNVSDVIRKV